MDESLQSRSSFVTASSSGISPSRSAHNMQLSHFAQRQADDAHEFAQLFDTAAETRELSLKHARLKDLTVLRRLRASSLRRLDLSHNFLQRITAELAQHAELEVLVLASNQIALLAQPLAQLTHLRVLDLSRNRVAQVSRSVFSQLVSLETLNLSGNSLRELSSALDAMPSLTHLDLSYNRLACLPILSSASRLEYLNLAHNQLPALSDAASLLPASLSTLDVSENQLRHAQTLVFLSGPLKTSLTHLNVDKNPFVLTANKLSIHYAPFVIFLLPNLTVLDDDLISDADLRLAQTLFKHPDDPHHLADDLLPLLSPGNEPALLRYLRSACSGDANAAQQHSVAYASPSAAASGEPEPTTSTREPSRALRHSQSLGTSLPEGRRWRKEVEEEDARWQQQQQPSPPLQQQHRQPPPPQHSVAFADTDDYQRAPRRPLSRSKSTHTPREHFHTQYQAHFTPPQQQQQQQQQPQPQQQMVDLRAFRKLESVVTNIRTYLKSTAQHEQLARRAPYSPRSMGSHRFHDAARKLQSVWRMYRTRKAFKPRLEQQRLRHEMWALRGQVATLFAQLQETKRELAQEREQRQLQDEALRLLWSEVKSIRLESTSSSGLAAAPPAAVAVPSPSSSSSDESDESEAEPPVPPETTAVDAEGDGLGPLLELSKLLVDVQRATNLEPYLQAGELNEDLSVVISFQGCQGEAYTLVDADVPEWNASFCFDVQRGEDDSEIRFDITNNERIVGSARTSLAQLADQAMHEFQLPVRTEAGEDEAVKPQPELLMSLCWLHNLAELLPQLRSGERSAPQLSKLMVDVIAVHHLEKHPDFDPSEGAEHVVRLSFQGGVTTTDPAVLVHDDSDGARALVGQWHESFTFDVAADGDDMELIFIVEQNGTDVLGHTSVPLQLLETQRARDVRLSCNSLGTELELRLLWLHDLHALAKSL